MKKIILGLVLIGLFLAPSAFGSLPLPPDRCTISRAEVATIEWRPGVFCPAPPGEAMFGTAQAICCVFNTIYTVTLWTFWGLILLAGLFIIVGGIMLVTSSGDPDKAKKARKLLIYAVVGVAVAFTARIVPGVARAILGVHPAT